MDKKLTVALVAIVVVGLGVIMLVNRVAINAVGLRTVEKTKEIAENQLVENWEQFFRVALLDLGREINAQEGKLQDMRVRLVKDRAQLVREKDVQAKYEGALHEFAAKVKSAGSNEVTAYGRTYTREAAQAQLREFAGAVVDQQAKVKALEALKAERAELG